MVGFHVLNNQVVGLSAFKSVLKVVEPLVSKVAVNCIHNRDFAVDNHIGVIRHAVGDNVLALKEVNFVVVNADVTNVLCYVHKNPPFLLQHAAYL